MKLNIKELHPTQFSLGYLEVDHKVNEFSELLKEGHLDLFLKEKSVPVVKRHDKFYCIDRHHSIMACYKLGIYEVHCHVIEDWSHHSHEEFWEKMESNNYCFLFDNQDRKQSPDNLKHHVSQLENDPYRSLAFLLRKDQILTKDEKIPFVEFKWAQFLRKYVKIYFWDFSLKRAFNQAKKVLLKTEEPIYGLNKNKLLEDK